MSFLHHHHPHVRRQFLKKGFLFMGALAPVSAAAGRAAAGKASEGSGGNAASAYARPAVPESGEKQEAREPYPVFDAHLHCPSDQSNQVWRWSPVTRTFEEFARYLDRTGVGRGIINNVQCQEAKTPADFIAGNREVAHFVEKYKGRFLGACVVNPLFIDEALKEIEYCRKQLGFVWVGELCNYTVPYKYTIKEFALLAEQVSKLNMVQDVHTELEEMEYIIREFPRLPSSFHTLATATRGNTFSSASTPSPPTLTPTSTLRATGTTASACSNTP